MIKNGLSYLFNFLIFIGFPNLVLIKLLREIFLVNVISSV